MFSNPNAGSSLVQSYIHHPYYYYSHVPFKQNASTLFADYIRNIRKKLVCCIRNTFIHTRLQSILLYFVLYSYFIPTRLWYTVQKQLVRSLLGFKTVVITAGRPSCCLCMIVNECRTLFCRMTSKETLFIMYYFLYILTIVVVFCLACPRNPLFVSEKTDGSLGPR